ncbi:MAG: hypothetical protein K2H13_00080 [Eubacterium sp.]|nr:hypothetical protein [Eubacterium sp.]MDE6155968.1 hypothetical protein [Eubacterium sp.]
MDINNNILRDLWDGSICPADKLEVTEEYKDALNQLLVCEEKIEKMIAPENKELLMELSEANTNLEVIAEYQAFECGFQLAVKLFAAALK